jgi:hypothetical protein
MMSEEDAISQLERFFLPAYAQADAGQTGPGGLPLDLKFAACLKDTKELVGMVFIETSDGSCELGYTVDSRWWGRGIATEMCQAVGMKPRRPAKGIWQGGEKNGYRLWELELKP